MEIRIDHCHHCFNQVDRFLHLSKSLENFSAKWLLHFIRIFKSVHLIKGKPATTNPGLEIKTYTRSSFRENLGVLSPGRNQINYIFCTPDAYHQRSSTSSAKTNIWLNSANQPCIHRARGRSKHPRQKRGRVSKLHTSPGARLSWSHVMQVSSPSLGTRKQLASTNRFFEKVNFAGIPTSSIATGAGGQMSNCQVWPPMSGRGGGSF